MRAFAQKHYLVISIFLLLSLVVNLFALWQLAKAETASEQSTESTSQKYPYLSKRIFTENPNDILINFTSLREVLEGYVKDQQGNDQIGLYFEYLPSGSSININSDMETRMASLIKIPTVMSAYKKIESGELSLDQTITLEQKDLDNRFGDLWKRGVGAELTLKEIIEYTLIKSDNTGQRVLNRLLTAKDFTAVLDAINIPLSQDNQHTVVTPKNYTSILRSLYLSSYLKREHSNEILDILTRIVEGFYR